MTRDEIEAKHAERKYWCAGPLRLTREHRDLSAKKFDEALALGAAVDRLRALRVLMTSLDAYLHVYEGQAVEIDGITSLVYVGAPDASGAVVLTLDPRIDENCLSSMITRLIRARTHCGAPLDVHALPYDGRDHAVSCAQCGNVAIVNRPIPEEDKWYAAIILTGVLFLLFFFFVLI